MSTSPTRALTPLMTKIVVVDVETDGLLTKGNVPHIVQLCYVVVEMNEEGETGPRARVLKEFNSLIKMPDGLEIDPKAVEVHGITTERVAEEGVDLKTVYEPFFDEMETADLLVAHNTDFDFQVLLGELNRMIAYNDSDYSIRRYSKKIEAAKLHRMKMLFQDKSKLFCTMKESVNICRLLNPYFAHIGSRFKFPKLTELCDHLFDFVPLNMHDARTDVLVCLMCFLKIRYDCDILRCDDSIRELMFSIHP